MEPLARTKPAAPLRRQVMDDVLHPGEVGVAFGRDAVLPTSIFAQAFAAPIGDVEGRVGEDKIGTQVGVAVMVEAVAMRDHLGVNAADGQVHFRQAPGGVVRFLAVDGDIISGFAAVAVAAGVGVDEFDGLHKHAGAEPQQGS